MKLSLLSTGAESGTRFLEQVKLAELLGFHAYFHGDRRGAREPFTRLGAAAQCTTKLGLAVCVADAQARHPVLLAQAAATLAEMVQGRLRMVMGPVGDLETPRSGENRATAAGLRQAVDLLRRLWRGETVALAGEGGRVQDGSLAWKPAAIPQLHIASREPQILALAGSIADGALIDGLASAPGIEYAKEHILPALQEAGRDRKNFSLCAHIPVSVLEREGDPVPEAIKRAARSVFGGDQDHFAGAGEGRAPDGTIPPGIVDSFALVGTGAQVVERLNALAAAGIEEAVISPFPVDGQDTEDFIFRLAKDVLPQFSPWTARAS
jgi:alkanesulfonate monooxygenase SsuD/methylene tetrahydromethanopterin reductase-like flavin-dependent oxidoreductase (luciferase family)